MHLGNDEIGNETVHHLPQRFTDDGATHRRTVHRIGCDIVVILSLGWGVQSFTLAAMSALGEIDPLDVAIHADTMHEKRATYRFASQWTPWLEDHNTRVITVRSSHTNFTDRPKLNGIGTQPLFSLRISDENGYIHIPAHQSDGHGQLLRSCTQRWKIAPLRRWLRANGATSCVEQWLGISWDESQRMRSSDVKYITNRYPLIEKRMTRQDCINWLVAHGLVVPEKSSCVFCPYHSAQSWRDLKMSCDGDFEKAVMIDEAIREARPPYKLFVHSSCRPLREVGNNLDAQPSLFDMTTEECSGVCFV